MDRHYNELYLSLQRYKMKAIHNIACFLGNPPLTVFIPTKIQNESNSQREQDAKKCLLTVFIPTKIQNESNSQLHKCAIVRSFTVFIPTKIQNESNSQPCFTCSLPSNHCIYPYKDTK